MSYDDGRIEDRRLVEIFNKYGIKATFHLNSSKLDGEKFISLEEIGELFKGHEVSCHMYTHPFPNYIPESSVSEELRLDKATLENACGYVVRGMSYPYGDCSDRVAEILRNGGMEYSRTIKSTGYFDIPKNLMMWNPTCHHKDNIIERAERFFRPSKYKRLELFYVWGHSYEFTQDNNWNVIEEFCEKMSNNESVWYATNVEIADYINALKATRFSQELNMAYNPSALDVWFNVNGESVCVPSGKTVKF